MPSLQQLLLLAPPILIALTLHEFAHAWVANRLGDPTAKLLGRLTLNPLKHLDPLGTLMLFVASFGWAKPVPVDPRNFRRPARDMLLVALAGPASNLLLAAVAGAALRLAQAGVLPLAEQNVTTLILLRYSLFINLVLAFFNLLPLPPLDGSKILRSLLPPAWLAPYLRFEQYGPFLLLALIVFGHFTGHSILWTLIGPFVQACSKLLAGTALGML